MLTVELPPLPHGWKVRRTSEEIPYFVNTAQHLITFQDPRITSSSAVTGNFHSLSFIHALSFLLIPTNFFFLDDTQKEGSLSELHNLRGRISDLERVERDYQKLLEEVQKLKSEREKKDKRDLTHPGESSKEEEKEEEKNKEEVAEPEETKKDENSIPQFTSEAVRTLAYSIPLPPGW